MPYYDTIEEDLALAKEILEKGKPTAEGLEGIESPVIIALSGGTIYGADIYVAYKLLESFVQHLTIPRFDLLEDPQRGLHAVLTRYGVASRTEYQPLVTALVQWAAAAYRSSAESFVAEIERLRAELAVVERESDAAGRGWAECVELNKRLIHESR